MSQLEKQTISRRLQLFKVILEVIPILLLFYSSQLLFKKGVSTIGELTLAFLLQNPHTLFF